MANDENSYTQKLSREIDSAYRAYQAGEQDSLEQLVKAFRTQARNVVFYRLGSDDPTLEQNISHRAFLALKQFTGKNGTKLSTWFYRIAQNEAKRELSRRIRDRTLHVSIDPGDEKDQGEEEAEREIQLAAKAVNHDAPLDLQKLRGGLSKEQAEVLDLSKEGYSLAEIAKQLGEKLGTIRSRYRLAKNKLNGLTKEKL